MDILFYDTMTYNTKFFCDKVKKNSNIEIVNIKSENLDNYIDNNGNFHLITYTIMQGEIPKNTLNFLKRYSNKIKTISSTGQKNWGKDLFAVAVDRVNELYPNIEKGLKIELQGNNVDVENMLKIINKYKDGGI